MFWTQEGGCLLIFLHFLVTSNRAVTNQVMRLNKATAQVVSSICIDVKTKFEPGLISQESRAVYARKDYTTLYIKNYRNRRDCLLQLRKDTHTEHRSYHGTRFLVYSDQRAEIWYTLCRCYFCDKDDVAWRRRAIRCTFAPNFLELAVCLPQNDMQGMLERVKELPENISVFGTAGRSVQQASAISYSHVDYNEGHVGFSLRLGDTEWTCADDKRAIYETLVDSALRYVKRLTREIDKNLIDNGLSTRK